MRWPKNDGVADFEKLTVPVRAAIRKAYTLKLRDYGDKIPWTGPPTPQSILACSLPFEKRLKRNNLIYEDKDQGRDPLAVIIGITLKLGIELGRRIERAEMRQN